jgi:23S rRNA pseudouridine2605 synthase
MDAGVRLQKYLAQAGVASRRHSETLIAAGRVRVNGAVASEPGTRVEPERDVVEVDGRRVRPAATEWLVLHKPAGYLSTRNDPQGRRTLYELLPPPKRRLFSVGRLDRDSEGLILLTNDGDVAQRLLHPRHEVEREYDVEVDAPLGDDALQRLARGVQLEDGPARAECVERVGPARVVLALREGRKREVRRMMEAVGRGVVRLRRIRYGPIRLGALPAGRWRRLAPGELEALRRLVRAGEQHSG